MIEFSAHGVRLDRLGNRGLAAAPQNSYACADWDDDLGQHRWVSIAVATDDGSGPRCAALGDPAWAADPALDDGRGGLATTTSTPSWRRGARRPSTEVVDTLWPAGVPVAVCVHPCEQLEFPQLVARDFFEHVEHPVHGDSVHVRFPFRLPGTPAPPPLLGEHNTEVFGDLLGLSAAELAALTAAGVIGTASDQRSLVGWGGELRVPRRRRGRR